MKIFISEVKKEAAALLKNNYNILVLTLFIPFLFSAAIAVKNFAGGDIYEIMEKMSSQNGTTVFSFVNFLMGLSGIAVLYGIKCIYTKRKVSLLTNYFVALTNIIRYLPTFFLITLLPVFLSEITSPDNIDRFYDTVLMLHMDYVVYIVAVQFVRMLINVFQFYLTVSLIFVPSILVETGGMRNFSGFLAIKESFRLTKGRKLHLFLLCISFVGWYILGYIAFIIGILWAVVFFNAAIYIYFKKIMLYRELPVIKPDINVEGGNENGGN